MIFDRLKGEKIDYEKPVFTLDVNQISLKRPIPGLCNLEYNFFETGQVELCVTPETTLEITKLTPVGELGAAAYLRILKSDLYKRRPAGTILELDERESNELWMGIRGILFPTVTDALLNQNQKADITQMFYHATASGSIGNSAFITDDGNFHRHRSTFETQMGIQVMPPREAWDRFSGEYELYRPSDREVEYVWEQQQEYYRRLKEEAERTA